MTFSGAGFSSVVSANNITIGNRRCAVVSANATVVKCIAPAAPDDELTTPAAITAVTATAQPVWVNGVLASASFTYQAASTPLLTYLSPAAVSTAITTFVKLTVTNVVASTVLAAWTADPSTLKVAFGSRACPVTEAHNDPKLGLNSVNVTCLLTRIETPAAKNQVLLKPTVYVGPLGYAALDSTHAPVAGFSVDNAFQVTSVSPSEGSLAGGTLLTVRGKGFPPNDPSATYVSVDVIDHRAMNHSRGAIPLTNGVPCMVLDVAADGTSLRCVLSRPNYEGVSAFNWAVEGPVTDDEPVLYHHRRRLDETDTTSDPTTDPTTASPTSQPTQQPSGEPTSQPSCQPTKRLPSSQPTQQPSGEPTGRFPSTSLLLPSTHLTPPPLPLFYHFSPQISPLTNPRCSPAARLRNTAPCIRPASRLHLRRHSRPDSHRRSPRAIPLA